MHKALSVTVDKVCVRFVKSFGNGKIYMVCSRARKLSDLDKSGEIERSAIKADQDFLDEYERIRKEAIFFNLEKFVMRFQMS